MQSPLCFITAVQRLGKSYIPVRTPSLLMHLITRVTSLNTSSMLLKHFPRSGFFNFGNKSSGGLMSGLYGGWGNTCHPYFSKISDTAPEAWGHKRSDSSQFLLPFQGSILQNRDHVVCQYKHIVLYWSLVHKCRENHKDCIIIPATQAQCAELLKLPTYIPHRWPKWIFQ
jgi:hypothetical protein